MRRIILPSNCLLCVKLFPSNFELSSIVANLEELEKTDWSAYYGQFEIENAINYLPNHYDRGSELVTLYAVYTVRNIDVLIDMNSENSDTNISNIEKAQKGIKLTNELLISEGKTELLSKNKPFLSQIGQVCGSVLVLYDADDLECAIPHSLITTQYFQMVPLAVFERGITKSGMFCTQALHLLESMEKKCVELTKDEKMSVELLGKRVSQHFKGVSCTWVKELL